MKKESLVISLFILFIFSGCLKKEVAVLTGVSIADSNNWSEEFGGTAINSNNWSFEIGNGTYGWGNNELQYYTEDNAKIVNGNLVITAKEESNNGYAYTSSRMISSGKFNFTYGTIEVNAKLPKGQGIWPAIWMLGEDINSVGWPNCGEIDIMELLGDTPDKIYGTLHGPSYSGGSGKSGNYTLTDGTDFSDKFHIFKVKWTGNDINWYVDGILYHTVTRSSVESSGLNWVFDHDFYIILNVAIGGNWPGSPNTSTVFPQTMEIDYIRVTQN